jgi:predicted nucleic acid-binding protein
MALADIPDGSRVYVDANIFVYHFTSRSAECTEFLRRVASGRLSAWTGCHTLAELAHRLLVIEAQTKGIVSGSNPAARLKRKPGAIKGLSDYSANTAAALSLLDEAVPVTADVLRHSQSMRDQHGLLVNDSIVAALLDLRSEPNLATADADFARVSGLTVYSPADVP